MLLYLGYLLVQAYPILGKLSQPNMPASVIIFSIAVFFIWTFIPITGYFLAKLLKANGYLNKYALFGAGMIIAAIENSLFYFKVLTYEQSFIGVLVVFILFFITAYISVGRKTVTNE